MQKCHNISSERIYVLACISCLKNIYSKLLLRILIALFYIVNSIIMLQGMKAVDSIMADLLIGTWLALSAILMLNIFIALMSDTFQR